MVRTNTPVFQVNSDLYILESEQEKLLLLMKSVIGWKIDLWMFCHGRSSDHGHTTESHFMQCCNVSSSLRHTLVCWLIIRTATIIIITAEEEEEISRNNRGDDACLSSLCRDSCLRTAGLPSFWDTWKNGYRHRNHPAEYWM